MQGAVNYQHELLEKLAQAGEKGVTRARLLGSGKAKAARETALGELLARRDIINVGTAKSPKFLLREQDRRLEKTCAAIEAKISPDAPRAFTEAQLFKGIKVAPEVRAEAMRALLRSGRIVKLQSGAKWDKPLFVHAAALAPSPAADGSPLPAGEPQMMPPTSAGADVPGDPDTKIRGAYDALVRESGFADVLVSDLQARSGVPLEALGPWLLEASRRGAVLPGRGDWSLASETARRSAIAINGEPHLRVRFA